MPSQEAPLKILHVMDKLSVEGSGIHGVSRAVSWWIPRFDPKAFQFHICCLRAPEPAVEIFEQAGIGVTFLSKSKVDPTTIIELLKIVSREKADILHLHGYGATNFGRLVGFLKGLPRIVHEHAILPNQPLYQTVADFFLSGLTTKAIAVSEPVHDFMVAKRSIPSRLIETLFVGVALEDFELPDEDLLAKARKELGIGGDELVIATIGRLDGEKGHSFLLEAAQMILKERVSARFLIIGDGTHDAKLKAQAKDLGIEKQVIFTGYRRDIPILIGLSDLVAIPSLREGGPLVLFEALQMRKPTVGTAVGLIPAVIEDGESGFVVPIEDAGSLAEKLLVLIRDPALAKRMGEKGRERCRPYDVSATVDRLSGIYRELQQGRR